MNVYDYGTLRSVDFSTMLHADAGNPRYVLARSPASPVWNLVDVVTGDSQPAPMATGGTALQGAVRALAVSEGVMDLSKAGDLPEAQILAEAFNYTALPLNEASPTDPAALRAVFLAGSGGSGKGFIGRRLFDPADYHFKFIDQDAHLERMLKAEGVPLSKAGSRYDLFNKARDVRNKEMGQYGASRRGIVVDSTGWDYPRIANPKAALENLGYDCYMVVVLTSLETAQARNKARGEAGGRAVPDSFIRDAHEGLMDNLSRYMTLFGKGRIFIIDNDEDLKPEAFEAAVGARLKQIAAKVISTPIANPVGIKWLETGGEGDYAANAAAVADAAADKIDHTKPKSKWFGAWDAEPSAVAVPAPKAAVPAGPTIRPMPAVFKGMVTAGFTPGMKAKKKGITYINPQTT